MESLHQTPDTYHLIITRRNASEILLAPNGSRWALPRVEIHPQQRLAEQLTRECKRAWGIEACCLLIPGCSMQSRDGEAKCAVMESVRHNDTAPRGTSWMPVSVAAGSGDIRAATLVKESLKELDTYSKGERAGPFAKPGWLRELFRWTEEQIEPLGLRLTGGFRQVNASATFSLVRLETNDGALWFKATGDPNAHELRVTLLLARLFPERLPRILGVHASWNGWLSAEAEGVPLDELTECSVWEQAAEELAELQIDSFGRSTELVEGGCKDLRLLEIEKRIDPFLARMGEFMRVQEKSSPAPLTAPELASLGEGLRESFSLLQSFGFPDTLGHLDCNPGNLLVSPERCVFLDWAEASVTNPVITFEYLRRHMERSGVKEPAADARITAAYFRPWASFFSPDELRRALAAVPQVAVFVHAVASDAWRTVDPVSNPALTGYFRSLTRRMFRDAVLAAERRERCLN